MHEHGYCEAILEAVENRAKGRPVERLTVRVGAKHRLVGEALDQAFAMVAAGTVADGAAVDLIVLPITLTCTACGLETQTTAVVPACPDCGEVGLQTTGGDELLLESIQLRVEVAS